MLNSGCCVVIDLLYMLALYSSKFEWKKSTRFKKPDIWGMSSHNCAHGHRWQCPPCISARAFENSLSPLVQQMIPLLHNRYKKNIQVRDVQGKLSMAVFVCQLMPNNAQWTCIVLCLLSNHVQCQQYRSGTCHSQLNTWWKSVET